MDQYHLDFFSLESINPESTNLESTFFKKNKPRIYESRNLKIDIHSIDIKYIFRKR